MQVEVNGTRLWFDVNGPVLVPGDAEMHERPTVVLVHGGPGSYDHSYLKPAFAALTPHAQVVYVDLRGHGRSEWGEVGAWSFELCADDIRALCDALGIAAPIVFGHSLGALIALLYGARHPGHASGVVVQSGFARFDLERLVDAFRSFGGDEVADLARRAYDGETLPADEWARVFAVFGPRVPSERELARRRQNPALGPHGMELMRRFDIVDRLDGVASPTLVCVGELDPVTPVAASEEIVDVLPRGIARLEIIRGAGHFPWLDAPERYWPTIIAFVAATAGRSAATVY